MLLFFDCFDLMLICILPSLQGLEDTCVQGMVLAQDHLIISAHATMGIMDLIAHCEAVQRGMLTGMNQAP